MIVKFGLSHYGESIVLHEQFDNANEYDMRMSMVVMSIVFGLIQLVMLLRSDLQIPCKRLFSTFIAFTVIFQTFHFADNIFMPAKHHEPERLYEPLLIANMDKTFLYQFVFLLSLNFATKLLSKTIITTSSTTASSSSSTIAIAQQSKRTRLTGWLSLAVFGAAQLLTAGHLLIDPLNAYVFDAALSIVLQSAFGLTILIASLTGLTMCFATPLELQKLEAIESGKTG